MHETVATQPTLGLQFVSFCRKSYSRVSSDVYFGANELSLRTIESVLTIRVAILINSALIFEAIGPTLGVVS